MNRALTMLIAGVFAVSLGACNKAEDPKEVQADVAAAKADKTEDVAEAQADASKDSMENHEDVAMAKIDGDHKIAIEKCEALANEQQKACKDEADATYEAAKAAADLPGPS